MSRYDRLLSPYPRTKKPSAPPKDPIAEGLKSLARGFANLAGDILGTSGYSKADHLFHAVTGASLTRREYNRSMSASEKKGFQLMSHGDIREGVKQMKNKMTKHEMAEEAIDMVNHIKDLKNYRANTFTRSITSKYGVSTAFTIN